MGRRPQHGLTLLELLIVISILALLVTIGVPGMRDLVLNNRQAGTVNEVITALQLARSEAISRNVNAPATVSVCGSSDGSSCNGAWEDGWIVFFDPSGTGVIINADQVIRVFDAPSGIEINAAGLAGAVRYRRDGRVVESGDFVLCDSRGAARARVVQLGISGRPTASRVRADGSSPACD